MAVDVSENKLDVRSTNDCGCLLIYQGISWFSTADDGPVVVMETSPLIPKRVDYRDVQQPLVMGIFF